jgi:mannose-6-phosphate isomerase-like protein (cupin superfamily)
MNRRSILRGAAAITGSALCPPIQADSLEHAIRVAAGQDRFNEHAALGSNRSIDCKVSAKDTNGTWSSFESHWQGKGGPPLHVHHDQDEWFYVIEGDYVFQVGGEKFNLTSGDSVLAPRRIPHTFAHLREERGRNSLGIPTRRKYGGILPRTEQAHRHAFPTRNAANVQGSRTGTPRTTTNGLKYRGCGLQPSSGT